MGQPAQELVASVMMEDGLTQHGAEPRHAVGEPLWHVAAVQRQVSAS